MLTIIDSPSQIFTAPLALLNLAQQRFPATINKCVTAALNKVKTDPQLWGERTYLPARVVKEFLAETKEAEKSDPDEVAHIATNLALSLAWVQHGKIIEVDKQKYMSAAASANIYKGLPIERLRDFPEYAIAFSTESFRVEDKDQKTTLLVVMAYLDEIKTTTNKTIPELTIALLYDHQIERQLKAKISKIPLSEGLSFVDAARRAKRQGRESAIKAAIFASKTKAEKEIILNGEAMEIAVVVHMIMDICAALKPECSKPSITMPSSSGQIVWPGISVLKFA